MQCIHKKGKIRGRRKEERNVNTGQGKGKVESAVMVVASAVTESILEQTGKHRVNVSGQPVGLVETELNSTAVTDCITTVFLL